MNEALRIQLRVILALIYREIKTRFGRSKLGIFWLFFEPLALLSIMVLVWNAVGHLGPLGIPPALFLVTGILPYLFFRNTVFRVMHAVSGNRALLVFPQVRLLDLMLARLAIEIIIYVVNFVAILVVLDQAGVPVVIHNPLGLFVASFVLWFAALTTGLFFIPIQALFPVTETVLRIVMRLLYFVSGIAFSMRLIPYEYQAMLAYNPFFHLIELIRHSVFVEVAYDPQTMNYPFVLLFFATLFVLGFLLTKHYRLQVMAEEA